MEQTGKKSICGIFDHNVQTENVKISELHDFQGHPFKVEHDMHLFKLSKSIEDKGVLVPLIVRPNPIGSGYEIIAGHRRKAASEWAGIDTVPVMIVQMDDVEATIAMVDSNLQREHIKPSEKAYAYKMKLEAMKQQERSLLNLCPKLGQSCQRMLEKTENPYFVRMNFWQNRLGRAGIRLQGISV